MCLTAYKIKTVNEVSPRKQYLPCGHCKVCRNSQKNSWSMRLGLELQVCQQKGWLVGFCTLTYNDECLPHFPYSALDPDDVHALDTVTPPCFDKKQVREFIVNIRRDLHSEYNTKGLKYMVCSEYGSDTQRPHYHCIFSWQDECVVDDDNGAKYVVGCSAENFFALIKKYWKFGFVFPKDLNGGTDSHGYYHKPFLVNGTARFAAAYAGKYCCKDMDFVQSLKGWKFIRRSKEFRNGDCFHIQSKSLGFSYIVGKSDSELQDMFFRGVGFVGDDKLHQLPLYLRNKILFSPKYIVERLVYDGIRLLKDSPILSNSDAFLESLGYTIVYKRLVRRERTEFFKAHSREIFNRRVEFWTNVFKGFNDADFLRSKGLSSDSSDDWNIDRVLSCFRSLSSGISAEYIASYYVSRFGLPRRLNFDIPDYDIWRMRFFEKLPEGFIEYRKLITSTVIEFMSEIIDFCMCILGLVHSEESEREKFINKLRDKYKSKE